MTPPDAVATEPLVPDRATAVEPSRPRPPARGPLATFRKYYKIFRVSLVERMTYRGDFLLGTLLRFLPMVTTILLWRAVYIGSGSTHLAGFRYREMIAYLLLTHISRMFSSMPNLASGIARDIREGTLKRYLIQPIDMIGYLLSYRVAHKAAYIATSIIPYGLLFFACRSFFDGLPGPATLAAYAASLVLSFLVGFFFEASVGMVGFWFLEVTSLLYIVMTLNFFISGQMLPLDLLPKPWSGLLKALPFQYMAYFPAVVFLGKVRGMDLVHGLLGALSWAVFFVLLARGLYRVGLRRYSAYGG
jgi:ABC-2 type transport system permease protein